MIPPHNTTPSSTTQRNAWFILAILLLFSIAAPLNQNKVPPILPILMNALNLTIGEGGLLMSVYALTGIILAIPAGFLFHKMGYRVTGLIAGGSIVLGVILGATSTGMQSLLVSRVIEGIGTCFIAVLAPAVIATSFPVHKRGTAMGIWAAWFPIGSVCIMLLAPRLAQTFGWQAVWWFGCAYTLVVTVLFLVFIKPAKNHALVAVTPSSQLPTVDVKQVLLNRNVWLLGLTFFFFCMAAMSFGTYTTTFLNLNRGIPLSQAAMLISVGSILSIFTGPLGGVISDRIGSRKIVFITAMVIMAVIMPFASIMPSNLFIFQVLAQSLVGGMVPANIISAAVETSGDERLGGLAMGVIMLGQSAGMLLGPMVFGVLVESPGGWPLAYASLTVMCLLGILAGIMTGTKKQASRCDCQGAKS
jgi:MFS family permease